MARSLHVVPSNGTWLDLGVGVMQVQVELGPSSPAAILLVNTAQSDDEAVVVKLSDKRDAIFNTSPGDNVFVRAMEDGWVVIRDV